MIGFFYGFGNAIFSLIYRGCRFVAQSLWEESESEKKWRPYDL